MNNLATLFFTLTGLLYLILGAVVAWRGARQTRATPWLVLYLTGTAVWLGALAAQSLNWLSWTNERLPLSWYGIVLLALLFLFLSQSFLNLQQRQDRAWARLGIFLIVLVALLDFNPFGLPAKLPTLPFWYIPRQSLALITVFLAWAGIIGSIALLVRLAYRQTTRQPLHRNRLTYWLLALVFVVGGDALFLMERNLMGAAVRLPGVLLAAYALMTYGLPDVRRIGRLTLSYVATVSLGGGLYGAAFIALSTFFPQAVHDNPLIIGGALAVTIAALFTPLLRLISHGVARLTADVGYNANRVLREYSLSISNVVELGRLEAIMMGLISETMAIQHGTLFLVDYESEGKGIYSLRSVQSFGPDRFVLGRFSDSSPIADYFHHENRALLQYDVDLLPRFQPAPDEERAWLASQGMEVYVPICAHGKWIGLLGLGPQISGNPYDKDDLILLSTLADQTAVALENARLFEDLVHVNQDLQRAYTDLEQANSQLQEMDRLKSAFIGVVTHELRTPFSNIGFSLQLLERYGVADWLPDQREELTNLKGGVDKAKRMVDNLVAFASFLSKQGQLRLGPVELPQLISETLLTIRPLSESKGVLLSIVDEAPMPDLTADGERLGDVLYHLIHNAVKFTETGGCVTVRYWLDNDSVYVEIKDTGVGIPTDKLPELWESFSQMADPVRRGVEGLGLGLALVKYIVTAHGGLVWSESEEGVGSAFGFHIPIEPES